MADDIQIKPAGQSGDDSQQANSAQSQSTSAQSSQSSSSSQATTTPQPAKISRKISIDDESTEGDTTKVFQPEKFTIPALVKEKFPDLVDLIKNTESMNDDEREYWFQILPIMTEDQISKFRLILVNEKDQLTKLDQEYEQELNRLNEKHLLEWKEFESKEKRTAIKQAEAASSQNEKQQEEDLLAKLSQI